jgi:hypothetical protein
VHVSVNARVCVLSVCVLSERASRSFGW